MNNDLHPALHPIMLLLVVLYFLILAALPAHCERPATTRNNGLGVVMAQDNIYMYNMGLVTGGAILANARGEEFTSLTFLPFGSPILNTEQVMLCDNLADELNKHSHKVVVLTYERQAHQAYQGVGCHQVLAIFDVELPKSDVTLENQ